MTVRIYTPEASTPKFVIRSNRCRPQKCCPMHIKPMDTLKFEIWDTWVDNTTGYAEKVFSDYC